MQDQSHPKNYDALVAAFCLVSYADGEMHPAEIARFIDMMRGDSEFRGYDLERIVGDIDAYVARLDKDFKTAKDEALARIQRVKNDFRTMERVIRVARLALIADGRIVEAEEILLADIHRALGLREEQ